MNKHEMALLERWTAMWQRLGALEHGRSICEDLLKRYGEPHRAYHNLAHLEHCFAELDEARDLAISPDRIALALWFHDAIYETAAKDNEEQSADLARATITKAALPIDLADSVAELILATKHDTAPASLDAQLLVDIDLAILGQPQDRFDEYERQVRQEYAWVSDTLFQSGRRAVLQSFLNRPSIYATVRMRNKYEVQARTNILRSLNG